MLLAKVRFSATTSVPISPVTIAPDAGDDLFGKQEENVADIITRSIEEKNEDSHPPLMPDQDKCQSCLPRMLYICRSRPSDCIQLLFW